MDFPQQGLQNVDVSGGLGGVFVAQNQMDAQKMRQAEIEGKGLANTFQGLQNERYGQATPLELQKLGGEAQTAEAKGKYDKETLKSRIDTTVSENAAKMSKAELEQSLQQNDLTLAKLQAARAKYLQAEKVGNAFQVAQQIAEEFGYGKGDPKIQAQIAPILQNPEKFKKVLDQFIEINKLTSVSTASHLRDMDKVNTENMSREKIAAGNNAATIEAANIHANAAKEAAAARGNKPLTQGQVIGQALDINGKADATPEERAWAQSVLRDAGLLKLQGNPGAFKQPIEIPGLQKGPSPIQQAGSGQQQQTAATSQADFDSRWAKLSPGQSLVGPDGKTYTKK